MTTVFVVTAGSGDTYRVERVAMRQWWTGDALPDAQGGAPRTRRGTEGRGGGPVEGEWKNCSGRRSPRSVPIWQVCHGRDFRSVKRKMETIGHGGSTLPPVMRHDRFMDQHALGRLGHHIVSRRVALGYRTRTDLANSLKVTVRTLSDIEHGVRKASPGTYAMLENKLAWAPGSIDTILAGGEPNELVVKLRRGAPDRLSDAAADAPSRASTEELLLELRRRIITPREAREVSEDWGGLNLRGDWPEEG
jgi:hypothetical protein